MDTKSNENNIVITTGSNVNDVVVTAMLATFMMVAGAVAYMILRQMESTEATMQNANVPYNYAPYDVKPFNVPLKLTDGEEDVFVPPVTHDAPSSTATHEFTIKQETHETELSPVTYLGYNTTGDLVGVMKRMPNGKVMRRKIRDPDMSLDNLEVDRWVEYNSWNEENDMNWI